MLPTAPGTGLEMDWNQVAGMQVSKDISNRPSLFSFTDDALLISHTVNRNNHRY